MRKPKERKQPGAERRIEPSPFGDGNLRRTWADRIDSYDSLKLALPELLAVREERAKRHLTDVDWLWIEARIEERVAVLRFKDLTYEQIRTLTLTMEPIDEVQRRYEEAAQGDDGAEIEALAADFRRRYKPPVMLTSPFMKTEVVLSERLMKRRSLNWFSPTIDELRARRGVTVFKEGWPEPAADSVAT